MNLNTIEERLRTLIQFIKYSLVGISNVLVSLICFYTLTYIFNIHYLLANVFAFISGLINSYFLNQKWVFKSRDNDKSNKIKFFIVNVTNFLINSVLLTLLVEKAKLSPLAAQPIIIFITTVLGFVFTKFWVFKKQISRSR